jgi:hypothetical protein
MNLNFNSDLDVSGERIMIKVTKKYICNHTGEIRLPWEPGLLEWLQEQYPASRYQVVELT